MSLTTKQLERFTAAIAERPERWRHLVRHASEARVYEQIWDDEELNAWLICWSHEQDTGFHDHDHSAAAIAVVEGSIREERLRLLEPPVARVLGPGSRVSVPAAAIHRVLHCGPAPAVTIHAYSPPLVRTGSYRLGPSGELERTSALESEELRPHERAPAVAGGALLAAAGR